MGTFSPRQVVTVVVAVCATVVLMPTAIWAASSSIVRLSDGSGKVAQIDSTGHLYVTDGKGPLTVDGTVKVAKGSSPLSVTGSTVNAQPVAPLHPWSNANGVNLDGGTPTGVLFDGVAPTKFNLTSFTYASEGATGTVRLTLMVYVSNSGAGDCATQTGATFTVGERFVVTEQVGTTTNLTYPTPLVYTNYADKGQLYCVVLSSSGPAGYQLHVGASGFTS